MNKHFVKISIDIDMDKNWSNFSPTYRIFVNDELFTERTFIWRGDQYLQEIIQIDAPPGRYRIGFENLNPEMASFAVKNHSVHYGPARWLSKKYVEIYDESN